MGRGGNAKKIGYGNGQMQEYAKERRDVQRSGGVCGPNVMV